MVGTILRYVVSEVVTQCASELFTFLLPNKALITFSHEIMFYAKAFPRTLDVFILSFFMTSKLSLLLSVSVNLSTV